MRGRGMDGKMIRAVRMLRQAERVQAAVQQLAGETALSRLDALRVTAAAEDLVDSARKRLARVQGRPAG